MNTDSNAYRIDSMNSQGEGITRIDNKVYFVPNTCIGDLIVPISIEEEKHFGRILEYNLEKESNLREAHPEKLCSHYGKCGGCDYLHIQYDTQLQIKSNLIQDSLNRIGKLNLPDSAFKPIVASPKLFHYRNKAQFHNSPKGYGFYKTHSHEVEPISECALLSEAIQPSRIFSELSKQSSSSALSQDKIDSAEILCVEEQTAPLSPKISLNRNLGEASSFSQVNESVNQLIQKQIIELIQANKNETNSKQVLFDLYCGNGNLSLPLIPYFDEIIGVDLSNQNIELANDRAKELLATELKEKKGCKVQFVTADCSKYLKKRLKKDYSRPKFHCSRPTTLILDPPRKGAKEAIPEIVKMSPQTIIYLSCNPATLARDLELLRYGNGTCKYEILSVTPYDMFPQTAHVETLAFLRRK